MRSFISATLTCFVWRPLMAFRPDGYARPVRLLWRPKLAPKPADDLIGLERVGPLALFASKRARSFAAGSQREPHQRTALRASDGFGCPLHGRNFKI
jgi:hypothetical protein